MLEVVNGALMLNPIIKQLTMRFGQVNFPPFSLNFRSSTLEQFGGKMRSFFLCIKLISVSVVFFQVTPMSEFNIAAKNTLLHLVP